MSRKKKAIILSLIVIVVFGALLLFTGGKEDTNDISTGITISDYNIEAQTDGTKQIPINIGISIDNLPTQMPIYEIKDTGMTEEEIQKLIKGLGVTGNPFTTEDGVFGKTLVYSSINQYLRIVPGSRIIDYKLTTVSLEKDLASNTDFKEYKEKAFAFLQSKGLMSDTDNYEEYSYNLISVKDEAAVIDTPPNVVSLSFITRLEDVPVLGSSSATGTLNVMLNSEGEVYRVYADFPPQAQKGVEYKTKTAEELSKTTLSAFTIQKIGDGTEYIVDAESSLSSISINKAEPAYYQNYDNQTQKLLLPIYVLSGSAKTVEGQTKDIVLYTPAISDIQD